jgi:polysaccharide pyruvyl transferase WcaK-like protein
MTLRIGLMGTFGYGNLGDAAIQDAIIQNIRIRCPDAEIIGFSLNPADTEQRHGIKSYAISRMSWTQPTVGKHSLATRLEVRMRSSSRPLFRQLERWISRVPLEFRMLVEAFKTLHGVDMLIISGGGQLDDYWGGGGPWSHPYTLLKYGLLARIKGARYIFLSVGAGPLNARLSQLFVRLALSLASYRSFRDDSSRHLLADLGFNRSDPVYPDLAHSLPALHVQSSPEHTGERLVGISPVGYFKAGCWPQTDTETYRLYSERLTQFAVGVIQRGYKVVFLPGEVHFDQMAIADIRNQLAQAGYPESSGCVLNPPIESVGDLLQQLQALQCVVASRFHILLLAQQLGKPVIALSYQSKIDNLMADTGQARYCLPVGEFDPQDLLSLFIDMESQSEAIRIQVQRNTQSYRNLLEEQYERVFSLVGI